MPKARPRFGWRDDVAISRDQLDAVTSQIVERHPWLDALELERVLFDYAAQHHQILDAPKDAEQKAGLEFLEQRAREFLEHLDSIDDYTRAHILMEEEAVFSVVMRFMHECRDKRQTIEAHPGNPGRQWLVDSVCLALGRLYAEQHGAEAFTSDWHQGEPVSEAAAFVWESLSGITSLLPSRPEMPAWSSLETAMRRAKAKLEKETAFNAMRPAARLLSQEPRIGSRYTP